MDKAILNAPNAYEHADRFIVATPTDTHYSLIKELIPYNKPILCEKPISKNISEVKELLDSGLISMMMQYRRLACGTSEEMGESHYDFYNHGNDGLIWDCFQIIALANGPVSLSDNSPVWKCQINGHNLRKSEMDMAYVEEVRDWIDGENEESLGIILKYHEKVANYERAALATSGTYWHSGAFDVQEVSKESIFGNRRNFDT